MAMDVLSRLKKKKKKETKSFNALEVLQIQHFFLDKSIYGTDFETKDVRMQLAVRQNTVK